MTDSQPSLKPWKAPAFQIGDIVEVTAFPEWAGEHYYIAEIERVIKQGEDWGIYHYTTWRKDGEGPTDGWTEDSLRLVARTPLPCAQDDVEREVDELPGKYPLTPVSRAIEIEARKRRVLSALPSHSMEQLVEIMAKAMNDADNKTGKWIGLSCAQLATEAYRALADAGALRGM